MMVVMYTPYADGDHKIDTIPPAPARRPLAAVLRSPSYRLLWSAQFVSGLAGFFNYVAVAWLTLQLTGSTLAVGSVLAAASVPLAVLMLLGGALSDRLSPRRTMLAAGLARGLVMLAMAALALTHAIQLWHLFVGAVLVGTTSAFFYPASTSMLPRVVASDQLEAGNALFNLSRTAAIVLGPALAGVLVATIGAGWALAGDAAGSMLAGLLVLPLPSGGHLRKMSTKNPLADIGEGVLHVWADVPLRTMLLLSTVLNFFVLGAVEVGLPALAQQRFTQGAMALGTAFGAWGVGSTIGALVAGARPAPSRFGLGMIGVVAALGVGVAAIGAAPSLGLLLMVMLAVGTVEGAASTYLISSMQRRTAMGMQGRVMSLVLLSSVGLEPLSLAMAGALASRYLGLLFWASASAIELTALGAALSGSVRRM
jgi:predicted MFS family arabinose efflux permease